MVRRVLDRIIDITTAHTRVTLLVMLLLTGGVLAGIPQLDTESQAGASADAFEHLDRVEAFQYVQEQYVNQTTDRTNRTFATVYVRKDGGNALSKASLLTELRFQRAVRSDQAVQAALHEDGLLGFSNLVARQATDEPDPSLAAQIDALQGLSEDEVEQLVKRTLEEQPLAQRFLPADHDLSTPRSTDRRILVALDSSVSSATLSDATAVLYEEAQARSDEGYFTLGEHELADFQQNSTQNLIELVLPLALALILFVLAFSYRDLVDIVVGMLGVSLSVLWMVGLLGWLGIAAGTIIIIPIVLITGLSIDFGFHVFNRYREHRGPDDEIRSSMSTGLRLVFTALVLVTITAAIGFLANLGNPLPLIRNLGVGITLGVVSALVLFTTVVPALKIEIDGLLERFGFDRRQAPLGHGRFLAPALGRSVTLARRAAPVVIVIAVVIGAVGGFAWTALDRESYQTNDAEVAEWKQNLPEPLGWDVHPYLENRAHVEATYQPASESDAIQEQVLIRGAVTSDDTLEAIAAGTERIREEGLILEQPGTASVQSPLTVMRAVAAQNESFAAAFQAADTDGNGVPDSNIESLYDRLFAVAPETARRVIERVDGSYRSVRVVLTLEASFTDAGTVVPKLAAGAETMADDGTDREATLASLFSANQSVLADLTEGILQTMVIALAAIFATLMIVFRVIHGEALLGGVVAVPIAMVLGLVIGGMYLLSIPLTLITALLMSLVIGLGIDYNIHIGDRFADELRAGRGPLEALDASVRGTGGALLGSTLTSAGAFATIILVPSAQLQSFGVMVVLALVTAFFASVLVLPSLLWVWARHTDPSLLSDGAIVDSPAD